MYKLLRPLFFSIQAERAHKLALWLLRLALKVPVLRLMFISPATEGDYAVEKTGIRFPNVIGLAAGFDKDGDYVDELAELGFGFIETGTVTPEPQQGNPEPRLFRLPDDRALINRMGFNNRGADHLAENLRKRRTKIPVGGNIGKNRDTPNDEAVSDYLYCFNVLYSCVDYFVINVSSPNTPGLRALQEKSFLKTILNALVEDRMVRDRVVPVYLKIAPDLTNEQLSDIVELVNETGIEGIIAVNTTISREGLQSNKELIEEQGGLSGAPLCSRSMEVLKYLRDQLPEQVMIISCGGIMDEREAVARVKAGADLIQVYTGFVYEGPALIKKIRRALSSEHS